METCLKDSNHSSVVTSQLLPTGYDLRHDPKKKGRGGGLAVVYKSQLTMQMLQPRPTASMECMEIDLTCASQKLSLCLIYRPPRHFGSAFLEEFADIVDSYSVTSKHHIILGDFNVHMNSDTSADAA